MLATPLWVQHREEQRGANLAAQIDWLRHRHHCWDPIGGPMPADISQTLDAINTLWFEAKTHRDEAEFLEDQAASKWAQANEKDDAAEELWKPLVESHPEWRDAFIEQVDPRTVPETDDE